jgi:hypothetical protein
VQPDSERLGERPGAPRQAGWQLEDRPAEDRAWHEHPLRKRPRAPVADVLRVPALAALPFPVQAGAAFATGNERPNGDPVSGAHAVDAPYVNNRPRELVAEHLSRTGGKTVPEAVQVGPADSARLDLDDGLSLPRDRLVALDQAELLGRDPLRCPHADAPRASAGRSSRCHSSSSSR